LRKFRESLLCFSRWEGLGERGWTGDCVAPCLIPELVAGGVVVFASQEFIDEGRSGFVCVPVAANVKTSGEKVSSKPVTY
jgi:hypothetical protein